MPGTILGLAQTAGALSLDGFARLAALGERRSFSKDVMLMKQGDPASTMFVILSGRVSVMREHRDLATPVLLANLGPGEIVGEMGLLDGEPRSATVTAIEDTIAVEVPGPALAECVAGYPDLYASLIKVLSRRLRSTDELVAQVAGGGTSDEATARGSK